MSKKLIAMNLESVSHLSIDNQVICALVARYGELLDDGSMDEKDIIADLSSLAQSEINRISSGKNYAEHFLTKLRSRFKASIEINFKQYSKQLKKLYNRKMKPCGTAELSVPGLGEAMTRLEEAGIDAAYA